MYHLKLILISWALLLVRWIDLSRGQQFVSEITTGTPSTCGSVNTVDADDVFVISDILSSEGRSKKAFIERSKGNKYFSSFSNSYDGFKPPVHHFHDLTNSDFPSTQTQQSHSFQNSRSFKSDQYSNKLSGMFPRLENEFGFPTAYNDNNKNPEDFYNFMQKKYTGPFKSEKRRFPEQASRTGRERITKKPVKKDILSKLKGKVVGKKKGRNASHADHKDSRSKLPKYVQHILDTNMKAIEATTEPIVTEIPAPREFPYSRPGIPERYPMGPVQMGGRPMVPTRDGGMSPLVDILGNLGPDNVQKLKQYLDTLGKDGNRSGQKVIGDREYDEGRWREEDERRHRPQTYNLNEYVGPGKSVNIGAGLGKRNHFDGGVAVERDNHIPRKDNEPEVDPELSEFPGEDRGIPDAVRDKGRRKIRVKRDTAEESVSRNDVSDGAKTCRWIFKKGPDCRKLVVRIQYWIDGVRDCKKEYMLISGGRHENDGDRLCGGQESLRPYIIEEEKVSIEHFRDDMAAGPGLTKFRGTVQCEQ